METQEIVSRLPSGRLSYSQVDTYLKCPQRYKRQYIDGQAEPMNSSLTEGLIVTRVIEKVVNHMAAEKGKTPSFAQVERWCKELCDELLPEVKKWAGRDSEVIVRDRAFSFSVMFLREEADKLKPEKERPAERKFDVEFEGIPFTGIIDLVERNYVIDFKVASASYFYVPDKSLQLAIYSVVTGKDRAAYMIFDKKKLAIEWKPVVWPSMDKITSWVCRTVRSVAESIALGSFPVVNPVGNALCSSLYCPHWSDCHGRFLD